MNSLLAGQSFKFWYKAARPISFGQSVTPYILGALLGLSTLLHADASVGAIAYGLATGALGLIGVIFAHSGMNLIDDYFDTKKGAVAQREKLLDGGFRARLGKCSYLKEGDVTLDDTKRVAVFFLMIALALAAVIFVLRGAEVLIFAGITLVLGLSYAGPPLRLSYRGFGELVIGFLFGPMLVTAASFLVSGQITPLALFCAIPVGLLVTNIVHTHALMDYGPDLAAQRKTLPILLGSERSAAIMSIIFVLLAHLSLLVGIILGFLPIATLLAVVTYPLSFVFIRLAIDYVNKPAEEFNFTPQKWMGNFGNWEGYQKDGIAWFMARWLAARNLVMQLTLVLAIAAFTPWYL